MAKVFFYAVFDSKVGAFAHPFVQRSRGEALRGFQAAVGEPDNNLARFPEDFALMELGSFDEETGRLESHSAPVNLGLAASYVRPKLDAGVGLSMARDASVTAAGKSLSRSSN